MFLAVIATLTVAALATLASTGKAGQTESRANQENGQVVTGRYTQYNETTMRFINKKCRVYAKMVSAFLCFPSYNVSLQPQTIN